MNSFMEYVCRGVVRSEDAIRCLNKRTIKLAKCLRQTNNVMLCLCAVGMVTTVVLLAQDNEIKALQKQVADLNAAREPLKNVVDDMKENTQQEGA